MYLKQLYLPAEHPYIYTPFYNLYQDIPNFISLPTTASCRWTDSVTAIIGRDVVANLTSGMSPRTGSDKVGSGVTGFRTKGKQNKEQQMKKKHINYYTFSPEAQNGFLFYTAFWNKSYVHVIQFFRNKYQFINNVKHYLSMMKDKNYKITFFRKFQIQ